MDMVPLWCECECVCHGELNKSGERVLLYIISVQHMCSMQHDSDNDARIFGSVPVRG